MCGRAPHVMLSGSSVHHGLVERYKLWLATLDDSDSVQGRYPRLSRGFCESVGEKEVIHLTPWDVRRLLVLESRRGRKYYAVYESLVVLRRFFDFLDLGGITTEIPLKTVRIRPPQLVPPHAISPRAIQRLVSAARNTRDAAPSFELLYATGCRSSELVGIKFDDVDFELRKIRVTGKNNKVRYVAFGTRAASAVMTYLDGRKSGYLFQSTLRQRGSVYCCKICPLTLWY